MCVPSVLYIHLPRNRFVRKYVIQNVGYSFSNVKSHDDIFSSKIHQIAILIYNSCFNSEYFLYNYGFCILVQLLDKKSKYRLLFLHLNKTIL